jgi:hypothetical protein
LALCHDRISATASRGYWDRQALKTGTCAKRIFAAISWLSQPITAGKLAATKSIDTKKA